MRKVYFLLCAFFFYSMVNGQATLAGWDVSGLTDAVDGYGPSPYSPTQTDPALTAGGLVRGAGVTTTGTSANRAWGGNGWNNSTAAANIAVGKFITFTLQASSGFKVSLTSLNPFSYRRSANGPDNVLLQYQINSEAFTDITTLSVTSTSASGATLGPISLSGISALQNVKAANSITIRLVPFGSTAAAGTFYIYDVANSTASDLSVLGAVTADASLPVDLVSFAGRKEGTKNLLTWRTATEINNKGFEIQHSKDGEDYTTLAFVPSQSQNGNSTIQLQYSYADLNPDGDKHFYRLRQLDYDGNAKLSNIVLLRGDQPIKMTLSGIFPNPGRNKVNVIVDAPERDVITLVIIDLAGRILKQQVANVENGSNTLSINIDDLTKGTYLIKSLSRNNWQSNAVKFAKQ